MSDIGVSGVVPTILMKNTLVWTVPNFKSYATCTPWKKGVIIKSIPPTIPNSEWEFSVLVDNAPLVIKTISVDKYNQEFEYVKCRDDGLTAVVATQTHDMTGLTYLNEPSIMDCLRLRYSNKFIYTSTGPILIAINPCEPLPIYTQETVNAFYTNGIHLNSISELTPHVYGVGDRAYRKMFVDPYDPNMRENQSILVSGESGAGKTVSMRHILHYLAVVSSTVSIEIENEAVQVDIESQIIATNPINESFGNARTSRNGNSSRFGKFTELRYSADGCIEGANIKTYLLETIRVPRQLEGERNFHIFYEIFAGYTSKQKLEYGLSSPSNFNYLNQNEVYDRGDGESDTENFDKLREAWHTLDIPQRLQDELLKIVIGILHLGNAEFVRIEGIGEDFIDFHPDCSPNIQMVTKLLGIAPQDLLSVLTKRTISVAGTEIARNLSYEAAIATRDTFAQEIYLRLFNWMMAQINDIISGGRSAEDQSASFIGLLDIFGFEFFTKNSFEQLCINYTNEKLQDHFNYAIFKSEQEVYREEGLNWSFVDYPDNSARLELLENKTIGVFALCDEQLKVPNCSDEKYAKSLYDKCGKHKFFSASKTEQARFEFTIKHFATDVKYSVQGFLDKNRAEVAKDLTDCLSTSKSMMVRQICPMGSSANLTMKRTLSKNRPSSGANDTLKKLTLTRKNQPKAFGVRKSSSTVSKRFSKDLEELILKIRATRSHFIRCIKPNLALKPNQFDESMVLQQLRCGGTLAAVQVFRAGFSHRMEFKKFVMRFLGIWFPCGNNLMVQDLMAIVEKAKVSGSSGAWRAAASKLLELGPITDVLLSAIEATQRVSHILKPGEVTIAGSVTELFKGAGMGSTLIFMKADLYEFLEGMNNRVRNLLVLKIQQRWKLLRDVRGISPLKRIQAAVYLVLNRVDQTRRIAARWINAAVKIQRRAKVYLTVLYRIRAINAASKIAALFRGHKVRKFVRGIRENAARKIQAFYRRYKLQKTFLMLRKFALQTQGLARRWLQRLSTKKQANKREKGIWAVIQLQAAFRGMRVRMAMRSIFKGKNFRTAFRTNQTQALSQTPVPAKPQRPTGNLMRGALSKKTESLRTFRQLSGTLVDAKEARNLDEKLGTLRLENKQVKELKDKITTLEQEQKKREAEAAARLQATENELKRVLEQQREIEQLKKEKDALKAEAASVQSELSNVKKQSTVVEEEHKSSLQEMEEAREIVKMLREHLSEMEEECANARTELVEMKARMDAAEAQAAALLEECPKCKSTLSLLEEANKTISMLRNELSAVEADRDDAMKERDLMKETLRNAEDNSKRLQVELDILMNKYNETEDCKKCKVKQVEIDNGLTLISSLKADLNKLEETNKEDIQNLTVTINSLQSELSDAQGIVTALKEQLNNVEKQKNGELADATELVSELREALANTQDQKQQEIDEIHEMAGMLRTQLSELEEVKNLEILERNEVIDHLQEQLNLKEKDLISLTKEMDVMRKDFETMQKAASDTTNDALYDVHKAQIKFLTEQLAASKLDQARLQAALNALNVESHKHDDDLRNDGRVKSNESDVATATELKLLRDQLDSNRQELSRSKIYYESEIQSVELLRKEASDAAGDLKQKIAKIQATNKVLEDDKSRLTSLLSRANEELSVARSRISDLERQLERTTKELEKSKGSNAQSQSRISLLEEQVSQFNEDIAKSLQNQSLQVQQQLRAQNSQLLARVQALDSRRAQAESDLLLTNDKFQTLSNKLKDVERENKKLTDTVSNRDKEVTTVRSQLLALEQTVAAQNIQIENDNQAIDELKKKITKVMKRLKKSDDENLSLRKELQEAAVHLITETRQLEFTKAELELAEGTIRRLQARLDGLTTSLGTVDDSSGSVNTSLTNKDVELLLTSSSWDPKNHVFTSKLLGKSLDVNLARSNTNGTLEKDRSITILDAVDQISQLQAEVANISTSLRKAIAKRRISKSNQSNQFE